ncbi:MAG TPA: four helix bundle protein [Anaerolineae bacterium]|nr:four helix bundle protein [Anaerolineae bacterium]
MNYADWEKEISRALKEDALWKVQAYRLGLFTADIGWPDVTKLDKDRRTRRLSDQLYRALGSVSANIAEGYSRSSHKDQVRFYEYALGSARESRDWYFKGKHVWGDAVTEHRMQLLTQIIRLLLSTIPQHRLQVIREEPAPYLPGPLPTLSLDILLQNIPF